MSSVQFHIDNICAGFTKDSLLGVVRKRAASGPATVDQIARDVASADRSLDTASAKTLAEAAVAALVESGELTSDASGLLRPRGR